MPDIVSIIIIIIVGEKKRCLYVYIYLDSNPDPPLTSTGSLPSDYIEGVDLLFSGFLIVMYQYWTTKSAVTQN